MGALVLSPIPERQGERESSRFDLHSCADDPTNFSTWRISGSASTLRKPKGASRMVARVECNFRLNVTDPLSCNRVA